MTQRVGTLWVRTGVVFTCLLLLGATGCQPKRKQASPPGAAPAASVPESTANPIACRPTYAPPDPKRPVIRLVFNLSADRRTVAGTENVRFTPDLPVSEMVFRLWPNGRSAPVGTALTVTKATVPGAGPFATQPVGARSGTQGTLLSIPLRRTAPAGVPITADLAFSLRLAPPSFERWGSSGSTAWWGSGQPLLAWEKGRGWQRQPAVRFPSEAAVSEAATTDLTVTAPAGDTVLMTGGGVATTGISGGTRLWHSTSAAVRDVSVSVSRFSTRKAVIKGVAVTVGASPDSEADLDELFSQTRRSVEALVQRFGPFPYPALSIAALPSISGGIEFPGSIMVGPTGLEVVVPHESAHEYFYGMVGDNQALDPWLDEAFATYSEALVNNSEKQYLSELDRPGPVDSTMESWGGDEQGYYATIYSKGAAALLTAREKAGPAAFDRAIRCYVNDNAWTVATPEDLARALAQLPAAIAVLRDAKALP